MPVVSRLSAELAKIASHKEMRERLVALGLETVGSTPEYLADFMKTDLEKWSKLIQRLGLKTD